VLCCAPLKQQRQLSCEKLAFHLGEFGLVSRLSPPALGVVAEEVSAAPDDRRRARRNLGAVNQALLVSTQQDRLENGATVRLDSTVSAAMMHEPSDSTVLWDAVRVMMRLLRRAQILPRAAAVGWRDRRRLAEKRARNRVQPPVGQQAQALWRADRRYSGQPRRTASARCRPGRYRRDGRQTLARPIRPQAQPVYRPNSHLILDVAVESDNAADAECKKLGSCLVLPLIRVAL